MNPGRFFVPNMNMIPYMRTSINPFISTNMVIPRVNMFERMANGIKAFNWKGLLNGANKTLNVMNQALPLVREARPMIGNVKSMVKLVRAFGNETNKQKNNIIQKRRNGITENKKVNNNTDVPTFFV